MDNEDDTDDESVCELLPAQAVITAAMRHSAASAERIRFFIIDYPLYLYVVLITQNLRKLNISYQGIFVQTFYALFVGRKKYRPVRIVSDRVHTANYDF